MGAGHRPLRGGGGAAILAYSALLGLGLLASAPWWMVRMATSGRYREGLGERLGRVPRRLREAVAGRRVVWVHAVSVGEVLAVSRLVGQLERALNAEGPARIADGVHDDRTNSPGSPGTLHPMGSGGDGPWMVVISTTTRTGQALARERFGAGRVFYLPLDFAWAVRAYLRALKPALVVLAESEIWPRLLTECERDGIPAAVVNARVSDRSFRRALRVRAVWGRVLRKVTLWLAQSDEDARRLVELGVSAGDVQVSGNLKFDVGTPKQSAVAELLRGALAGRPVIVAGSTVEGEDQLALGAFDAIWRAEPRAFLVMAPRHPERFAAVLELAADWGAVRATSLTRENVGPALKQVVVLDTIGDLAAVYRLADAAFVGGSLVAKGGHNPLEPAQFGVPVVIGPSYENFRAIVEDLRAEDAIRVLPGPAADGSKTRFETAFDPDVPLPLRDALASACLALLRDREAAEAQGERGRQVFLARQGAAQRTVEALAGRLRGAAAREGQPVPEAVTA